jgi:hypothetical protein
MTKNAFTQQQNLIRYMYSSYTYDEFKTHLKKCTKQWNTFHESPLTYIYTDVSFGLQLISLIEASLKRNR